MKIRKISEVGKIARRAYRVDRRNIAYLKFILEAYDNLAQMSTVDPRQGLVIIRIVSTWETAFDALIAELAQQMLIEPAKGVEDALDTGCSA